MSASRRENIETNRALPFLPVNVNAELEDLDVESADESLNNEGVEVQNLELDLDQANRVDILGIEDNAAPQNPLPFNEAIGDNELTYLICL